jgi:hypothetical protein
MGVADRDWSRDATETDTAARITFERTEVDSEIIGRSFETLRNPNVPLDRRLEALDSLAGRRLTRAEHDSAAVYTAELARLVAEAGEVRTRTITYHVEAGVLRRRLNF